MKMSRLFLNNNSGDIMMGKRIMIWLMVMICWIPIPVNAEYDIPEYVKVGVRSGSNAVATVKLASGTGFDFG